MASFDGKAHISTPKLVQASRRRIPPEVTAGEGFQLRRMGSGTFTSSSGRTPKVKGRTIEMLPSNQPV